MKTINHIMVALLTIAPAILVGGVKISMAGDPPSIPEKSVLVVTAQAPNNPVPTIAIKGSPAVSLREDKTKARTGHVKVVNLPASNGIMQTITIWIPDPATDQAAMFKQPARAD